MKRRAKPASPGDLAGRLKIDPEKLDRELCDQPRLYYLASAERVRAARIRSNLELELRAAKSDAMLRLKQVHPRASSQLLQAMVSTDETVRGLELRLAESELEEETAKALVEAFRQRRECLGLVLDQNRAEAGAGAVRRRVETKYPGR